MWDDIQGYFGRLPGIGIPNLGGLWDDIRSGKLDWEQLSPEQQKVIGDAVIGQAGVEGNQALRETVTPTEEIAAARIPPPTPLEEKGAYMEGRGGYDAAVTAMNAPKKEDKDDDLWNQIFLMSLMEEMQGGKPGQAPGVVLGGRSGGLPSMMGQFKRQQKPWWIV
tara:strand:- start:2388 stop:2882 length:495 start_codon:yes stop_codon:yes gene_type:complete